MDNKITRLSEQEADRLSVRSARRPKTEWDQLFDGSTSIIWVNPDRVPVGETGFGALSKLRASVAGKVNRSGHLNPQHLYIGYVYSAQDGPDAGDATPFTRRSEVPERAALGLVVRYAATEPAQTRSDN